MNLGHPVNPAFEATGSTTVRRARWRRLPRRMRRASLRARLLAGAGMIAFISFCAAVLVVYGASETIRRIDVASGAQARLETLGTLSARVNDYAVVAIEAAGSDDPGREGRLASRAEVVHRTFQQAAAALAEAVAAAQGLAETEQMARATRSLGLARMQAQFDALDRRLTAPGFVNNPERLRAELDSFATRFSPLMDRQIVEERRARDEAFASIRSLAGRLLGMAGALVAATLAAVLLYYHGLIRPLLDRLGRFGAVAGAIGSGATGVRTGVGRHDELGLVSTQINRMAARLDRRAAAVAEDRMRLEQTIAERTEALRETNERLERIDTSRRRFFADIGHELRTPLTVIRAEADLGVADEALEPATRRSFEVIRSRAARLNRRVADLLRVARSESGEIALDHRPFDLAVAVREALEDAQPVAERRRVRLEESDAPALPAIVHGDADWTRQVIAGLLDNAIRHSPEGGRVRAECRTDDDAAVAIVTDEGSGIAAKDHSGIFERFRRAGDGTSPGFGIGLALAKWVVERQSGQIACDSPATVALSDPPKGPGAEFRVTFPREKPA